VRLAVLMKGNDMSKKNAHKIELSETTEQFANRVGIGLAEYAGGAAFRMNSGNEYVNAFTDPSLPQPITAPSAEVLQAVHNDTIVATDEFLRATAAAEAILGINAAKS
jgi:hypothetical protein